MPVEPPTDAEESFRLFVATRSHALGRTAYLLTGDVQLAEDLVQTALYRAAARWERLVTDGHPEAYVRRILVNEHVSWWRRHRGREVLAAEPAQLVPGQPSADDDAATRLTVRAALALLTPKQRAVLVLRCFDDLTEVETAATLGCAVGTVKSQTRHALSRLRVLAPELRELVREADS